MTRKTLWASDVFSMNDSRELLHGQELLEAEIHNHIDDPLLPSRALERIKEIHTMDILDEIDAPHVVSLSENSDCLDMWRGYGEQSTRYALEMNSYRLLGLCENKPMLLAPCIYDLGDQKVIVERYVKKLIRVTSREYINTDGYPAECEISMWGLIGAKILCLLLKHPAFINEREWRMIVLASEDSSTMIRCNTSYIIQYIEIILSGLRRFAEEDPLHCDDPIKSQSEILGCVIGPCPNKDVALRGVKVAFINNGLSCFKDNIRHSSIPYRDW